MSKFIKISFAIIIAFVSLNVSVAQKISDSIFVFPTYTLTVSNLQVTQPNRIEFDVYMKQTNGDVTPFIYGSAQYYWDFNPGIAFPGDTLRFVLVSSDLPQEYRPVNPSITGNILRMAPNLPTNPTDSPRIDTTSPGTLIAKMRIRTTGTNFTNEPINLAWRGALPNPFTKVAAFTGEDNLLLYEIQDSSYNFIDPYTSISGGNLVENFQLPTEYSLSQNFPNPFNPTTKIDYSLPVDGSVKILVYDIAGREVMNLVNETQTAGNYSVNFNGINLASGMYFYRINVEGSDNKNFTATKRMVLIK
ncbi:MAG: T9SS type A sorting domain-containing protein [Ignavibacteriae bacterium]|nr:T9SS type A sorting domain-containing protein [Ignavibacteriota bacterium]